MKKTLKTMAVLVGGLIALLVVLAVSLTLLFDPNQYKGKLIEAVRDQTGRELRIDGKLGWSFFPWIGIEAGRLELGNAPGFDKEPFARIDGAGAKIELLPLLRRQVIVDTIFLDGLKLNLARNAAGKTNWDDLTAPSRVEKTSEKTIPGEGVGIGGVSINKIDIRQADLAWNDRMSGARLAVRNLDLETGKISVSRPTAVRLSFDFESGRPPVRTHVDLKSLMSLDLKAQTLDVTSLALSLGELTLLANFKGAHVFDAPHVSGSFEIAPFNARAFMNRLGVKLETTDKKTLEKLALRTEFAATAERVELKDLALTLDESRLTGTAAIRHFAKPAYQFDLALDQIDLDRYLPAPAPAASGSASGAGAPAKPAEIPSSALRALAVQGKLRVRKLKTMNLRSSDAVVRISADNGLIALGPNQAKLYNGKYAGRTTLDVRGNTPLLNIDESVSGIELAPALKDVLRFDKFAGAARLSAKLTARGLEARQFKETLNGTVAFSVHDGRIKGMDVKKMVDAIDAARRERSLEKLTELKPDPGDETRFTQLGGTARIKNGVVQNNDLEVHSPNLPDVSGKGSADLPREMLDYTVTVGSYAIVISGPFSSPRFRPDTGALLKAKVEEKKSEMKGKWERKLKERFKLR